LTIYDVNNRDTSGAAKMLREFAGYEGFLSSCRYNLARIIKISAKI